MKPFATAVYLVRQALPKRFRGTSKFQAPDGWRNKVGTWNVTPAEYVEVVTPAEYVEVVDEE